MENVKRWLPVLALSAVLSAPALGAAQAQEAVKFGILTGLTGDYGPWGEAGLAAAQIAVEDINAAGGINGRPLELVVADHKSSIEGAVSGWKRLVEVEQVVAVAGMESDFALALLDESAEARVPITCPACGTPKLATLGGQYVWRLTAGDDDLGVVLAQIAASKTDKIAVITQTGLEASEGISKVFIPAFEKAGGEVVEDIHISADAASYRGELDRAMSASDHLMVSTGLESGTRLLTEYLRRGYEGTLYFIPELIANEVADLGGGALVGHVFGASPTYDTENPAFVAFAEKYAAKTGIQPSTAMYEPNYYDQIIVLALAAAAAGGDPTGETIRNNLAHVANEPGTVVYSYGEGLKEIKAGNDIAYYGASGSLDFNEFGNVVSLYGEVTPKDGQWVEIRKVELDAALRPTAQ